VIRKDTYSTCKDKIEKHTHRRTMKTNRKKRNHMKKIREHCAQIATCGKIQNTREGKIWGAEWAERTRKRPPEQRRLDKGLPVTSRPQDVSVAGRGAVLRKKAQTPSVWALLSWMRDRS